LFIVPELEIVLHDHVFVFLDLILVKVSLLNLREVPCDDILPRRCDNGILFLPLALIEARIAERSARVAANPHGTYRATEKLIS